MRFHLFGLAHLPVKIGAPMCAFTPVIHGLAKMLHGAGHEVILYGAAGSDAPCSEFVEIVAEETLKRGRMERPVGVDPNINWPEWQEFCRRGEYELLARAHEGDIGLITYGNFQRFVANVCLRHVETNVGYQGVFTGQRVFASYAWMHQIYGLTGQMEGRWYDTVVPHWLDLDLYPKVVYEPSDYFLYLGRMIPGKGADIACELCRRKGVRLIAAGVSADGAIPDWTKQYPQVEFVGAVGHDKKVDLLSHARAVLVPSRMIDPCPVVVLEAMACGCPVISTDWGGLTETVVPGATGVRCRTAQQFLRAMNMIEHWDRAIIKTYAAAYGLDAAWSKLGPYLQRYAECFAHDWWSIPSPAADPTVH